MQVQVLAPIDLEEVPEMKLQREAPEGSDSESESDDDRDSDDYEKEVDSDDDFLISFYMLANLMSYAFFGTVGCNRHCICIVANMALTAA